MKHNLDRQPDGGNRAASDGRLTVVGARKFLIAYNVNLNTSDIGIAIKSRRRSVFIGRLPM